MLTTSELKALLRRHDLRLSKRLGQHHLVDRRAVERLVDGCRLVRTDTVIEIGAGLGALTELLAERVGRVLAVEVDAGIAVLLRERLRPWSNVTVCHQDILTFPWARHAGAIVVGAIPYQITSEILAVLCEQRRHIREAWLLLQREVAQRVCAQSGTKAYGRLSVLCQYSWALTEEFEVRRDAFYPRPTVDSSFIHLHPRLEGPYTDDEAGLFRVVRAAFAQRRKTLVKGLVGSGLATREQAQHVLRSQGLAVTVRGEMLSLQQFIAVSSDLKRLKSSCLHVHDLTD